MSTAFILERVPARVKGRSGDWIQEGRNNSLIIMGTDRARPDGPATVDDGLGSAESPGGGRGAGSIHLMVGRKDPKGDPSFDSDSAFIYMSMQTRADDNLRTNDVGTSTQPSAALVLKSEAVRAVGRTDLKFVMQRDGKSRSWLSIDENECVLWVGGTRLVVREDGVTIFANKIKLGGSENQQRLMLAETFSPEFLHHYHTFVGLPPTTPGVTGPPFPDSVPKTTSGAIFSSTVTTE